MQMEGGGCQIRGLFLETNSCSGKTRLVIWGNGCWVRIAEPVERSRSNECDGEGCDAMEN